MTNERTETVDWRRKAGCIGVDPEVFFPETEAGEEVALLVCAACPVREACLADALRRNEKLGVLGGKTEAQRRSLRRAQASQRSRAKRQLVDA